MSAFIVAIVGAVVGLAIGWMVRDQKGKSDVASAEAKAADVVKKAEAKEQDVLIRAKDKAVKILEEARIEEKKALEGLKRQQASLVERENAFGTKLLEVDDAKKKLEADLAKDRKSVVEGKRVDLG